MARHQVTHRPLWQVCVRTSAEAEEAVSALMEEWLGCSPVTFTSAETKVTTAMVYLAKPLDAMQRTRLNAGLKTIADCGLDIGEGTIKCHRVRREDWSESWKKHFKTIEIGPALRIKPSWNRQRARKGQVVVVLDPGLSFGTGQHPTTSFCLRELVAARQSGQQQSFLDIGTGSGILAIAAVKLGYAPVRAFDYDPVAVRIARSNAKRNRVQSRLGISRSDLTKLAPTSRVKYDLICANLIDDLLVAQSDKILNRLKPTGTLVLAGILRSQFPRVRRAFVARGLKLVSTRIEREWQSAAFVFRKK